MCIVILGVLDLRTLTASASFSYLLYHLKRGDINIPSEFCLSRNIYKYIHKYYVSAEILANTLNASSKNGSN